MASVNLTVTKELDLRGILDFSDSSGQHPFESLGDGSLVLNALFGESPDGLLQNVGFSGGRGARSVNPIWGKFPESEVRGLDWDLIRQTIAERAAGLPEFEKVEAHRLHSILHNFTPPGKRLVVAETLLSAVREALPMPLDASMALSRVTQSFIMGEIDFSGMLAQIHALPSMPALYGSLLGTIINPNNIAPEGSQMGRKYEHAAIKIAAKIFGFDPSTTMGHFVAGGSVANLESLARAHQLWTRCFSATLALANKGEPASFADQMMGLNRYFETLKELGDDAKDLISMYDPQQHDLTECIAPQYSELLQLDYKAPVYLIRANGTN